MADLDPRPSLRSYDPPLSEKLKGQLHDLLTGLGMNRLNAQHFASKGTGIAEMLPISGNVLAADMMQRSNNPLDMVLGALGAVMPAGAGPALKGMGAMRPPPVPMNLANPAAATPSGATITKLIDDLGTDPYLAGVVAQKNEVALAPKAKPTLEQEMAIMPADDPMYGTAAKEIKALVNKYADMEQGKSLADISMYGLDTQKKVLDMMAEKYGKVTFVEELSKRLGVDPDVVLNSVQSAKSFPSATAAKADLEQKPLYWDDARKEWADVKPTEKPRREDDLTFFEDDIPENVFKEMDEEMAGLLGPATSKADTNSWTAEMISPEKLKAHIEAVGGMGTHQAIAYVDTFPPVQQGQLIEAIKQKFPYTLNGDPHWNKAFGDIVNTKDIHSSAKSLFSDDIDAALAKNPGASIADVAGVNTQSWAPKQPIDHIIKDPSQSLEIGKSFLPEGTPKPEWLRELNRVEGGYTTPAFHGTSGLWKDRKLYSKAGYEGGEHGFYSSSTPDLANKYADEYRSAQGSQQVLPLWIDTRDYHRVNALEHYPSYEMQGGVPWEVVNSEAVHQAKQKGKKGVVIENVFDEPASTKHLPPQTIHITFDPTTVRSKHAQFDPKKFNVNDLLAGLAGAGIIGPAFSPKPDEYK